MQGLLIQLDRDDASYVPGEPITGRVVWELSDAPERVIVRLLWRTSGKGSIDMGFGGEVEWDSVGAHDQRVFSLPGVDGPYSFSGKLITLSWHIEAVAFGTGQSVELPLTLSPTGQEVRL